MGCRGKHGLDYELRALIKLAWGLKCCFHVLRDRGSKRWSEDGWKGELYGDVQTDIDK